MVEYPAVAAACAAGSSPSDGAECAVEAEFGDEDDVLAGCLGEHVLGGQERNGNRHVVAAAVLGQAGWQQPNGEVPVLPRQLAVENGGADTVADFADGRFGQPVQMQARRAAGSRGLHIDEETLHPDNGGGAGAGNIHLQLHMCMRRNLMAEERGWSCRIGCPRAAELHSG
jgi:hypothetical protein